MLRKQEQTDMRRGNFLFVASLMAVAIIFTAPSHADSLSSECTTQFNAYVAARSAYLSSSKPSNADFKNVSELFQKAQRERVGCLQDINRNFKDQLQAIKNKYQEKINPNQKKNDSSSKAQRDSEVASVTLNRDNSIRSLPVIPELPSKAKREK